MESFYNKSEIPDELQQYFCPVEIGLEETPEQFVAKLVDVFREVKRVLKDDGTLWLNLGDSYAISSKSGNSSNEKSTLQGGKTTQSKASEVRIKINHGVKQKDLIGIPWMVAFALRADGWYLRQDIIWHKPNPMPESVTDRCTKSHEYIFLLSKSARYYYDHEAIKQPLAETSIPRLAQDVESQNGSDRVPGKTNGKMKAVRPNGITRDRLLDYDSKEKRLRNKTKRGGYSHESELPEPGGMANKRSVWTVTTKPYSEAHFATYPEDLIVDCIKAGCPEYVCNKCGKARDRILETETIRRNRPENFGRYREINGQPHPSKSGTITTQIGLTDCGCNAGFSPGIVLDPFMGAGTTALVARKLNRNYIGFELNPEYIRIAKNRLQSQLGLFV